VSLPSVAVMEKIQRMRVARRKNAAGNVDHREKELDAFTLPNHWGHYGGMERDAAGSQTSNRHEEKG